MNWLDPSEVEAWLNQPPHLKIHPDHKFSECFAEQHYALEQFVRSLAASDECCPAAPCDGVEWQDVARLLVKAMGEK